MTVLNLSYVDICRIPVVTRPQTLWVCSVPVTLLFRPMIYMVSTRYMTGLNSNVTGTEQTHKVWDIVTTGIRQMSSYDMFEPGSGGRAQPESYVPTITKLLGQV